MSFAVVLLQATPTIDATVILNAIKGHQLAPVVAVVLYFLAAAIKQGWLGTWLQAKLSPRFLPFLSPVAGVLSLSSVEILAGAPWLSAVVDGLMAGLGPILGHEVVVEAWRNGKEIVPAKKSSSSGGGSIIPLAPPAPKISDKPEPPTAAYVSIVWARRVLVCFVLATMTVTTGCAATQQWWDNFQKDPAAQVRSFVQYVQSFAQTASTVWAMVSPLLGANTPQANADFNAAMATLNQTLGVAQDAVQTALAAQQPTLDLNTVFAPVQDAVARVLSVISTWKNTTTASARSIGGAQDTLTHQAGVIARWH